MNTRFLYSPVWCRAQSRNKNFGADYNRQVTKLSFAAGLICLNITLHISVAIIFRIVKFRRKLDLLYTTLRLIDIHESNCTAKYATNKNAVDIEP